MSGVICLVCCNVSRVLLCRAVCCSVLQCVAVSSSVQCVAYACVVQCVWCVAVSCTVLRALDRYTLVAGRPSHVLHWFRI